MRLAEFENYINELLLLDKFTAFDYSLNGLQVARQNDTLEKIAFAVDASLATFTRAREQGADLLFVHHGLFWGKPVALTGNLYRRVRFLVENDIALMAVHLPLDSHPELGNNAYLAAQLGLVQTAPFGEYKGVKIGVKGRFPQPLSFQQVKDTLAAPHCLGVLDFGPQTINSVGISSGGDPAAAAQAIAEGLDLFITGDASHTIFHDCQEAGVNVIFGGHYFTEMGGVLNVCERVSRDLGLATFFIDLPTGL